MGSNNGNVVSIGNFDGFHSGHRSVLTRTLEIAEQEGLGSVLITFHPNPRLFFKSEKKLIFTEDQKEAALKNSGIEKVVYLDFQNIYKLSGSDFIEKYLLNEHSMKFLVVGENFKLGKDGEFDLSKLREVQDRYGFKLITVESERYDGIKISSSVIRNLLYKGDLEQANEMLGRPYSVDGKVIKGRKLGRKLGFRTANVFNENCLLPNGVYKTDFLYDGKTYRSATYIGETPTLQPRERKMETHIFDFDGDLYGETVSVLFYKKIREEKKFTSEIDLVNQVKKDLDMIRFDFITLF